MKFEPVAHGAAHAVEGRPLDEFRVHAALQNEILQQPADLVVRKGGGDGGLEAKTAAQAAGDIIFAAAFPDFEFARAADAAFAGIEPEHDFAEGEQVVFAGGLVPELDWHSGGELMGDEFRFARIGSRPGSRRAGRSRGPGG